MLKREIDIPLAAATLAGILRIPEAARGIVLFAHGSGSSRHSPRNNYVAEALAGSGMATLLSDLLTAPEEQADAITAEFRFDMPLLTARLVGATEWLRRPWPLQGLPLGYFGASTGAAAALAAAAQIPEVCAVVSRGGRPDLAGPALARVRAPTLLIVGGDDPQVLSLNRAALARLGGEARLEIVPHATHLFVEPGALEQVAALAADWFARHLRRRGDEAPQTPHAARR